MSLFLAAILSLLPAYQIRFSVAGLPTTLLEMLVVVFLFLVAVRLKKEDFQKIKNLGKINYAIYLFVLAAIISTIISPEPYKALGLLKAYVLEPVLLFYAILLTIKTQQQLTLVLRCVFWSSVVISLLGIFQHYTFIHLPLRFWGTGEEVARITSVFGYPNALSLYLGPLVGLFTVLWMKGFEFSKNKYVSGIGLIVLFMALLLTFSRGAWIAVTVVLLFAAIKHFGVKSILPLLIIGSALFLVPTVRERVSVGLSDPSSSAHLDLMRIGTEKALEDPVLGNGLYGFRTTLTEAGYEGELINYPHNIILNFWLETGMLGLLSFIWILFITFSQQRQPTMIAWAGMAYLSIVLLHGLVDAPYFKNDLAILFWFVISLFFLQPQDTKGQK